MDACFDDAERCCTIDDDDEGVAPTILDTPGDMFMLEHLPTYKLVSPYGYRDSHLWYRLTC